MMMRKRMLSLICALALCLGLLPVTALADGTLVATVTIEGNTTEYSIDETYAAAEAALAAAWTACQGQTATLTLMQDVELDSQLNVNSGTTLTLCMGDSVTLTSAYSGSDGFLYVQGSLDFQSGTIKIDNAASSFKAIRLYDMSAVVTLSGGNIELNGDDTYGVYITQGTFNMTGGTITATGSYANGVYFNDGNASANISGGTISAGRYGINAGSGNLKISGGATISSDNMYAMYVNNTDVQLSGGTYSGASGSIWAYGSNVGTLLEAGYAYYDTDDKKIEETNVAKLENYKTVTVKSDSAGELTITTQPIGKNAASGGSATFTVEVSGATSPSYQWEVSTDNGTTWTPITGANQATLTISNATIDLAGNLYHCVVSDGTDSSVTLTSASAILTVNNCYRLTVIGSTGSGAYAPGAEVTISAPVEDSDGGYFWKWASDGVTISSPSTITNTFTMPSGNVTVTARYSDVIEIEGYMTKTEFVEAAEELLNEKVSSTLTWTNTISSETYITKAGDFTFTATDPSGNKYEYGIMAKQTMAQIDMGSQIGENWNYDEDTGKLTVYASGNSYEVSFGTTGIKACENYVYVPTDALVTYKNADGETGYRLNMTITGENAENAYPVLTSGMGYKYVEDYEKNASSASISPESYLTDAKTGQSEYAIPVLIDKYGAINVWFSQKRILSSEGTGSSYSITLNGDAGNGRTYQMTAVNGKTFGNLGRVFFEVTPPTGETRAWAVLIVPSDKVDDDTTGSGVTIDTSWGRSPVLNTNGHLVVPYSLFENSAGQLAAVYLQDNTTAVISEITLTADDQYAAEGGEVTLSVTADYQFKDMSGMPGITYQWYECDADGSNGQAIDGATGETYTTSFSALGIHYYYVTAKFNQFAESNTYYQADGTLFSDYDSFGWASDTVTTSKVITVTVGKGVELTATVNQYAFRAGEALTVDATVKPETGETETPTGTVTLYMGDPEKGGKSLGSGTISDGSVSISYMITKEDVALGPDQTLYIVYSGDSSYRSETITEEIDLLGGLVITAAAQDGKVLITWEKPQGYDNITGYKLYAEKEGLATMPVNPVQLGPNETSCIVDKLQDGSQFESGTVYEFYLIATYSGGEIRSNTEKALPIPVYDVTVETDGNGTATSSPAGSAAVGSVVTLTATPNSGYHFVRWEVVSGNITISNNSFAMPAEAVTVKAIFARNSSGGGGVTRYQITVEETEHGKVTSSHSQASQGTTVTLTIAPDEGYELASLTITQSNGEEIEFTDKDNGKFTFTMPASKVTVEAIFTTITPGFADCPKDETCPIWPFTDASTTDWYHDGVHYCLDEGLMEGYGDGIFKPDNDLSRAMLVQILYNLEGRPAVSGESAFTDVADGAWYFDAVTWAAANGIVGGYGNGKFGPEDNITREQLAAILYRYTQAKEYDVSVGEDTNILSYTDALAVSEWAVSAMQWACGAGVIEGVTTSTLVPQGNATRAQVATMLMRFCAEYGIG